MNVLHTKTEQLRTRYIVVYGACLRKDTVDQFTGMSLFKSVRIINTGFLSSGRLYLLSCLLCALVSVCDGKLSEPAFPAFAVAFAVATVSAFSRLLLTVVTAAAAADVVAFVDVQQSPLAGVSAKVFVKVFVRVSVRNSVWVSVRVSVGSGFVEYRSN